MYQIIYSDKEKGQKDEKKSVLQLRKFTAAQKNILKYPCEQDNNILKGGFV